MDSPQVIPQLLTLSAAADAVVKACRSVGARPLVVGAAVRDGLLAHLRGIELSSKNLDIHVHDVADHGALEAALSGVGHLGERSAALPVLPLRVDGQDFEISGACHDPGKDRATSLREALGRRDYTIDALGWDPETGELIDLFGGRADLRAGILRHTSSSFGEEPLRVLRGVQLAGRFGFSFASETRATCRELADRFSELPIDRIWGEWRELARSGEYWPEALDALHSSGWLRHFPELAAIRGIPQDPRWHSEGDVWTHSGLAARSAALAAEWVALSPEDREIAVFGALVHDFGKVTHTRVTGSAITSRGHAEAGVAPARSFLETIGAPASLIHKVVPLVREHMAHVSVDGRPSTSAVRRLIRRLGGEGDGPTIEDWARVVDADCAGRERSAKPSPASKWLAVADSFRLQPGDFEG